MLKAVAFIPARGGSKGIPRKNILPIAGKPLIQWVIEAASGALGIDRVFVSTDSVEIAEIVNNLNDGKVEVIERSEETATDTASTEMALLEFANNFEFSSVVLIQATSPLLTSIEVDKGLDLHEKKENSSIVSVVRQKRFLWEALKDGSIQPSNYDYKNRPRRQDFEGFLVENGAFYITTREDLLQSRNRISGNIYHLEMPEETYFEIDEYHDWTIVEEILLSKSPDRSKFKKIKLFLTDVDGVLTDAGMYYSEKGDESKKFNTHDGMGFQLLRQSGIKTGIITSESTKIVERRAKKLQVDFLYQGKSFGGKLEVAKDICKQLDITLNEVAYIGDDLNCIELLSSVGVAACPQNASTPVKKISKINILQKNGGEGVVREFVEKILEENGVV